MLRIRFHANGVNVDLPSWGYDYFDDGDVVKPDHELFSYLGAADYPKVEDTWYILAVKEVDSPLLSDWSDNVPTSVEHLQTYATGMHAEGKSRSADRG